MNNRVHDSIVEEAVSAERERAAVICETMATIMRYHAKKTRKDGTFNGQTLHLTWPFIRSAPFVAPKWESAARTYEACAAQHEATAKGIRSGRAFAFNPLRDPDEKITWRDVTDADGRV